MMKAFIEQSLPRGADGEDTGGVAAAATTGGTEGRCMLCGGGGAIGPSSSSPSPSSSLSMGGMRWQSGVEGQPQDMEHNRGREGGNGGGNQAAATGHECACPPRARSCNPSPPWANGRTKIVGRWVCVRQSMAGNSSQCSLPPPWQCPAIPPLLGLMGVKDCQLTTRARQLAPKGINPRVVEITICSCHQTMIPTTGLQGFRGRFIALPCP